MGKAVNIVEVGPRDGLQNETPNLSVEVRREFIEKLVAAGHRHVEFGSFVHPKWVPQMQGADALFNALKETISANRSTLSALVPNLKGYQLATAAGIADIAVVISATESFNQRNLNQTIENSLNDLQKIYLEAKSRRQMVRTYLSVCFGCPYEGAVAAKTVARLARTLIKLGAKEISISDTIGVANPLQVRQLMKTLSPLAPIKRWALHFHDTRGLALANVLAGLEAGVRTFDSSTGGLGGCPFANGAAGNLATEDLVYMLNGMGFNSGIDLQKQLAAGRFIQQALNKSLPGRYFQMALKKENQ